jgi:hypothetical protein
MNQIEIGLLTPPGILILDLYPKRYKFVLCSNCFVSILVFFYKKKKIDPKDSEKGRREKMRWFT